VKKKKWKKMKWVKKEKGQHEVDVLELDGLHSNHQDNFGSLEWEKNHTNNPMVNLGRLNVAI
jgi:hypothetical protein